MSKILFLLEDYNHFYSSRTRSLVKKKFSYSSILSSLLSEKYYQADSMANAFNSLGHTSEIIIPEANPLQLLWARENNSLLYLKWMLGKPFRSYRSRIKKQARTAYNPIQFDVLLAQAKKIKPDVIYFYSNIFITHKQVATLKKYCKKVVLQWTCPIWREQPTFPYGSFDLIISAAIQLRDYFQQKKYKTVYIQQAFDTLILEALEPKVTPKGDLIFIGSFSLGHTHRFEILEFLLESGIDVAIHGLGKENIPANSLVYKRMAPPLFGLAMYNEYRKYKMAIHVMGTGHENDSINWAQHAGAKRLFEITGVGTLLLTSHQENVKELFEIDKEVVTFTSKDDLLNKIRSLLNSQELTDRIADSGMKRTLKDHSFKKRAEELSPYLFN